jgi:hypothetical protein
VNAAFEFKQNVSILRATGGTARDLRELRQGISSIPDEAIYHHTYQYFQKGLFREYTNDFAHWAGESLEERALSEQLSNIDPYEYHSISDLRAGILDVIDAYLRSSPEPRSARTKDEFHFADSVTISYPLGIKARNLAELMMGIKYVDERSLYHHFYEARVRLPQKRDDFSVWIETALGKDALAGAIRAIDPFMHSIEGIRTHLLELIDQEVQRDMQSTGGER